MNQRTRFLVAPSIRAWLPGLLLSLIVAGSGCEQTQKSYGEGELADPQVRSVAAHDYWQRHNLPALRAEDSRRVAIVDFTVEFVTESLEAPPYAGPADPPETPEQRGKRLESYKAKEIVFQPEVRDQITRDLYDMLTRALQERSREIVPTSQVVSTRAYQSVKTIAGPQTVLLDESKGEDPDAGLPRKVIVQAAPGMQIFKKTPDDQAAESAVALLKEVGGDVAVRAQIRVGVFRGRATIERGSRVWVLSRDVFGDMTLARPLVSDGSVLTDEDFQHVHPDRYVVDSEKYRAALGRLFPTALELGFASGSAQQ